MAIPTDPNALFRYQPTELGPAIQAILRGEPFDAAEFTLAGYIILKEREQPRFTAIPAFPARSFFHSCLWVRRESPLHSFKDLVGKRIGLRDYTSTTSVWFRGHLKRTEGVDWGTIAWVVGPNRRFPPPSEADITPTDGDLEDKLLNDEIDAFFSIRVRDQKKPDAERRLRPLLEDPHGVEANYYRASGLYPLLHVVVVSDRIAEANYGAPKAIFDLFQEAKRTALRRKIGSTLLPWGEPHWEQSMALFDGDPLPYGLTERNRCNIQTLIEYLHDQKLIQRKPHIDELFWPNSAEWT
ncbi:PhnD/SsuA/transferrin family substrate-binding protein [Microvirga alba]|uniref:4,5-dihydroxyphthalate decarboxylase n=1 Tax=Microvirga alba TaxID=2791025 RepID=A0A931BRE1_9HYPH|nr:PhnD/SsuA/transferrin family substrate-binding protein [Microvirga alba]MBF9233850.1 hypothetical protein [Microvirga alba]